MSTSKIILLLIIITSLLLRIYKLSSIPPSLYWDEVSLGYNAYSVLLSGRDEHAEFLPLDRFIAFGDFKPPGYIYATIPSILVFGLSEFAVRFPSAISGVLLVFAAYLLAKEIFAKEKIALLSALVICISPWSLQLSRGGFEANMAITLNALGIYFMLRFTKGRGINLPISSLFFILSFYTFNSNRIIAPILLSILLLFKAKDLWGEKKWVIITFFISLFLILPSYNYLMSRESKIRFQEVSIFNKLEVIEQSNQRIAKHNDSIIGGIVHNRRVDYFREFLKHYFDHFKGDFLFIKGDFNPRLSSQSIGELYVFDLPFLIIGILFCFRLNFKKSLPLFLWLLISIIPAAVSKETPHALRTASAMPVYQIFIAFGLYLTLERLKNKKARFEVMTLLFSIFLIFNIYYYLHDYYIHYPRDWAGEWQYGYKEVVKSVRKIEDQFDYILVTESYGRPYIYFLFYNQINPEDYWKTRDVDRDWFGFRYVNSFGKYVFNLDKYPTLKGNILIVGRENETKDLALVYDTVYSPNGEVIFRIGIK